MYRTIIERRQKKLFGSRRRTLTTLTYVAGGLFALVVAAILGTGILFAWYAKDLPRPDKIKRESGLSTVVLDRNGLNLYDIFEDANRIPAKFEEIPQYLKDATIAIEDKTFYTHQGLSGAGFIRAFINIIVFRNLQGGSTLTQQLVKTVLLSQERTLPRKMKEAILSIQIERKYTKDEILQMYLNEVPYGGTAVGVKSAAKMYFGKPLEDLSLIECALIAGLPQSPSRYSPFTGNKEAYVWRTGEVLRRMREDGYISKTQEEDAKKQLENLKFASEETGLKAPHFIAYVKELLAKELGAIKVEAGGLTVTTTLDWKIQEEAQKIVLEEVDKLEKMKVSNGAAVVLDPLSGEILAMVGSKDYEASESGGYKFNVATQGLRQPGSTLKPISYATALKKGYTASTLLMDVETKYPSGDVAKPEYNPKNYDLKYRGPMQLRFALGNSINTIAVKISALVGIKDILTTAYDMGIASLEPTADNLKRIGLSLTLGGGEVTLLDLTGAFGVFATGGIRNKPIAILSVSDSRGKVLFAHKPLTGERVLPEDVSFIISQILSDNDTRKIIFGERSYLVVPGKSVAVKTGTTDDKRDNWTVGFTRSRVVGVWVGNNDNSPMHPSLASGVTGAAPIWNRLIKFVTKDAQNEPFTKPDSVIEMEIDGYGGGTVVEGQATRKEYFIKGTEPTGPAAIYRAIKVSKRDNNKLANSVEINRGEYDTKTFIIFSETDPVSTDGTNRWQEGINAWVASQQDVRFHPPTETYSEGEKISVRFIKPGDNDRIDNNNFEVRAEAASMEQISKLVLYADDQEIRSTTEKSLIEEINLSNGSHVLKVKAWDMKGNSAENTVRVGINEPYATSTPVPQPTPTPVPTATPAPIMPTPTS
jgi:penicillin-binding protein 1C